MQLGRDILGSLVWRLMGRGLYTRIYPMSLRDAGVGEEMSFILLTIDLSLCVAA